MTILLAQTKSLQIVLSIQADILSPLICFSLKMHHFCSIYYLKRSEPLETLVVCHSLKCGRGNTETLESTVASWSGLVRFLSRFIRLQKKTNDIRLGYQR